MKFYENPYSRSREIVRTKWKPKKCKKGYNSCKNQPTGTKIRYAHLQTITNLPMKFYENPISRSREVVRTKILQQTNQPTNQPPTNQPTTNQPTSQLLYSPLKLCLWGYNYFSLTFSLTLDTLQCAILR